MKVLLVYAHPEPKSLNGSLKDFAVKRLEAAGHQVRVSDLYAMNWKASLDADDSPGRPADSRFNPSLDSKRAFEEGRQSQDIALEQEKNCSGPMPSFCSFRCGGSRCRRSSKAGWNASMPMVLPMAWGNTPMRAGAIVMEKARLREKRAMLIVTAGGWESHYSPRGINGPIDDVLFPIQHGVLFYPGFDVLPPFVIYRTSRMDEDRFSTTCDALGQRLDDLWKTAPIPFRPQNAGAYDIPQLTLRAEITSDQSGFAAHVRWSERDAPSEASKSYANP